MAELRKSRTQKLEEAHVLVIGGSSGLDFAVAHLSIRALTSQLRAPEKQRSTKLMEQNVAELFEAASSTKKLDHVVLTAGDAIPIMLLARISAPEILTTGNARNLRLRSLGVLRRIDDTELGSASGVGLGG
ncbi:MAG: hypothetical protein Q9221_003320 [Calogaya cf. arnoldii]